MTNSRRRRASRPAAFNWELTDQEAERVSAVLPDISPIAKRSPNSEDTRTAWERRLAPEDLALLVPSAEILVALSMVPREVFQTARALRFVSSLEHGVNWLPFDILRERRIRVANCRGARDAIVAEQAFALLLACAKRLIQDCQAARDAFYQPNWVPGQMALELAGETLAIVGLGGIGRAIARRAKAFDMHVIGIRRRPDHVQGVDEVLGPDDLPAVLSRSRFVVLIAPYTPSTRGLMNEPMLRAMRPDAYLINMARAALVDERAIFRALTEGWISGYASDVWWDYGHTHFGVPSRLGVHRLPNVIGTGDRSINVPGDWQRVFELGLDNVRAYLDQQPLARLVDLDAGY